MTFIWTHKFLLWLRIIRNWRNRKSSSPSSDIFSRTTNAKLVIRKHRRQPLSSCFMTTCWTEQTTVSKQFWMLFCSSHQVPPLLSPSSCILGRLCHPNLFSSLELGIFQNCDIIRGKFRGNISEDNDFKHYTSLPKVNLWFYIFSRGSKLVAHLKSGRKKEEEKLFVSSLAIVSRINRIIGRSALYAALIFEQRPWFSFSRTMVECVGSKLRTFLPRCKFIWQRDALFLVWRYL